MDSILSLSQLPIVPHICDAKSPSVFISYSWDNDAHKEWVAIFGRKLCELGISVDIDINHNGETTFSDFMSKGINENRFVICVLSSSYIDKINSKEQNGVLYEFAEIKKRCRTKEAFEAFAIPIIKNNNIEPFLNKLPCNFQDIHCWNFDSQKEACVSFAKIVARLLSFNNFLLSLQNTSQQDDIQHISDKFYKLVADYWVTELYSEEAKRLKNEILSIFSMQKEKKTLSSQASHLDLSQNQFDKVTNSIGKWDDSYEGDREIIAFLAGDSDNE